MMVMSIGNLKNFVTDWRERWVKNPGMIVVQRAGKVFEIKDRQNIAPDVDCVGCGGWDEHGNLLWVGIDLDVGHGKPEHCYQTREEAIEAACALRLFVNEAAEVRMSKSGKGVHVRVAIAPGIDNGRINSRRIAWWLARQSGLKCDTAVLGRQNLWFWSKTTFPNSFFAYEPCNGVWTPPKEALEEPQAIPAPAPVPKVNAVRTPIHERARKYLATLPIAVSGQGGHGKMLRAACVLVVEFDMSVDEARPLLREWNQTCQPPFSERELEHKLNEAYKKRSTGNSGRLLRPNAPSGEQASIQQAFSIGKTDPMASDNSEPQRSGIAASVFQQMRDEVSGKRFAASWPFPLLGKLTQAMLPKTVTMIPAPKGSSKSFMIVQCMQHWIDEGYNPACLMLEDDRTFHARRALAQYAEIGDITSLDWVVRNGEEKIEELERRYKDWLEEFAQHIYEIDLAQADTDTVLRWIAKQADKSRVMVVDPITVRTKTSAPWLDDSKFIKGCKQIMNGSGASLILTAHPPKTTSVQKAKAATSGAGWGDDIAGGQDFGNLAHNILYLEYMPETKILDCIGADEVKRPCDVNRKIEIRKSRSGRGQGMSIGMYFDPRTLALTEQGLITYEGFD